MGKIDTMHLHSDNQAMIRICRTGKNPSMRYLATTHGVQVGSLHERTTSHDCNMHDTETSEMAASIFTKFFPTSKRALWENARKNISVLTKAEFEDMVGR